jgi:hypothetical protein
MEPVQAPFPHQSMDAWLRPAQRLKLFSPRVVEIDAVFYRLKRCIAVPVKNKVGCPELGEISRKIKQPK